MPPNRYLRQTIPFEVGTWCCPRCHPSECPWCNRSKVRVKTECERNNRSSLSSWTAWVKTLCRTENTRPCKVLRSKRIRIYSTKAFVCDPTPMSCLWVAVPRHQLRTVHIPLRSMLWRTDTWNSNGCTCVWKLLLKRKGVWCVVITYGAVNFEVMDRMSFDFSDCFVRNLLRLNLLKDFVVVVSLLSIVEILSVLIFKISLSLSLSESFCDVLTLDVSFKVFVFWIMISLSLKKFGKSE